MVKKINGKKPTSATTGIEKSRAIDSSESVADVKDVKGAEQKARAERARRPTRPMTPQEREHLFSLINEEADKLFGPDGLPESQRETVEGAVRMAVDAAIIDEDEEAVG